MRAGLHVGQLLQPVPGGRLVSDQRIGGEQATDPASDDDDMRPEAHHINSLWRDEALYHHTG